MRDDALADAELARRAQAGDREAAAQLVDRYRRVVYGHCYHRLGGFEEAQDATQETFVQAIGGLPSLTDPQRFGTWLFRITANVCAARLRRTPMQPFIVDHCDLPMPPEEQPEAVAVRAERQQAVLDALTSLSEEMRLVLTLFYFDDCSHRQIAGLLGVPEKTVKSRLYEARQRLKAEVIDSFVRTVAHYPLPQDFAERVLHACGCTEADCACVRRAEKLGASSGRRQPRIRAVSYDR